MARRPSPAALPAADLQQLQAERFELVDYAVEDGLVGKRAGEQRGGDAPPKCAQALFALSTNHEAWPELTEGHHLGWDTVEARLTNAALTRSLLA